MQRLWFVTNPASGSATPARCEAIEAIFAERGLELAGKTGFPDEPLPDIAALDAAGVDTLVLFAGDGTINAALCSLATWDGGFLILPGGTMNMLARALHGERSPAEIVHAAHAAERRIALPFVEAGAHRAFVGLVLGPGGNWFRPREMVRKGRFRRVIGAVRQAWRRTFRDHVRVGGAPGLTQRYQAIFITGHEDGLDVAGIDARDWRSIAELGWDWLTGDWVAARAVTETRARELRVLGRKPALALFDGEPQTLEPKAVIASGMSRAAFLATE